LSTLGATFKELTDKKYLKKMIHLLIPMALAGVLTSSLQIVDTLMIATLGDVPVAGVGLANRLTYFLSFLFASVTSGVSIYSAQFWGEKNQKGLRQCLSFAMMLILPIAVVFSLISIFAPHLVMRIFSQDEAVIEAGCTYLRFIAPAYLFQSVTALLAALLKATERPSLPMTASAAGIALNIVLNYILIFGKFGAPQMGVKGAAVATLIAAVLEMVLLIVFARLRKALEEKDGSPWVVGCRFHPNVQGGAEGEGAISMTRYPDMQELIMAADCLITDYSSCMFDMSVAGKPCFLYAPDLDEYMSRERGLYFDIRALPFPLCRNMEELEKELASFDTRRYLKAASDFLKETGSFEDGQAAARIANAIVRYSEEK